LLGSGLDPGVVICNLMFVVTAASDIIKFMQAADKDGAHTLLHCKGVREVWRWLRLEEIRENLLNCSGRKEMMYHIMRLKKDDMLTCPLRGGDQEYSLMCHGLQGTFSAS
jgi:hypothetical protein